MLLAPLPPWDEAFENYRYFSRISHLGLTLWAKL